MKKILALLSLMLTVGLAHGAELPPPGSTGNLAGNGGGFWAPFTFSNCTVTGTSISCPGTVSGYPAAGIPQSTGSAWGSSITAGTGVVTALGNATNATGGLLTFSGAFGTPTSLTLTNATGLPTTGLTGALQAGQFPALTGDITTSAGALATTLATVNSNVGSFGSATNCVTFTTNAKGLISAASQATCTPAIASVTGIGTGVATALGTAAGSAGAFVVNGGALGTPSSGSAANLTATTQTGGNNSTAIASTAYVDNEVGLVGETTISTTGGSTTLTAAQYATPVINVTGALTSAATLVMPNNGDWKIQNNTTGNFTLTIKTNAGTGIPISPGYTRHLLANGTNVIIADSDFWGVGAYTNTAAGALDPFYACLRKSLSTICRIVSFGDSIITCYQISPCTYGPYNAVNSPILALRNELLKSFVQYSTGLRVPFRLMPTAAVDSGEGGYTLTSGTVSNAAAGTYGPGQTGYSLNGQALLQCSSGCVLTINVGQGYRGLNIYCVQTASSNGWTVTVGGTSLGTACGSTSGTNTGLIQNFSNAALTTGTASSWSISGTTLTVTTVASGTFATGGVLSGTSVTGGTTIIGQMTGTTGGAGTYQLSASSTASSGTLTQTGGLVNSTFTLTALGANSVLGGYEAITTMGNVGVAVDNMGEGAISSAFWTQNSTALGWFNQLAGQVGLCIHEGGQNDSQNPSVVTPAQVAANFQSVATACQNRGAAFSFFIPTPYNSTTTNQYAWIQQYVWEYGQAPTQFGAAAGTQPWDILTLSDAWAGQGVSGISGTGGIPNFQTQDSAATIAQSVSAGLLQAQDSQHPSDQGSCLITSYIFKHLFARNTFNCNYNQLTAVTNNKVKLTAAYTNATTGFTTVCEASCVHSMIFPIIGFQTLNIRCHMIFQVSAAATISMTIAGSSGSASSLTQTLNNYTSTTTNSDVVSLAQTAYGTAVTSASVSSTATNLSLDYTATVTHVATANAASNLSVQMHPSTGTLTVEPDSLCIAE